MLCTSILLMILNHKTSKTPEQMVKTQLPKEKTERELLTRASGVDSITKRVREATSIGTALQFRRQVGAFLIPFVHLLWRNQVTISMKADKTRRAVK